eukprot:1623195-Amphidinium_carterae.5
MAALSWSQINGMQWELGIDAKTCKGKNTPIVKWRQLKGHRYSQETRRQGSLEASQCAYPSQDSANLQVTVKYHVLLPLG